MHRELIISSYAFTWSSSSLLYICRRMQIEGSLKVTNTYRNILKIALPISIAILIPQLNFLTNTLFLGYYKPSLSYFSTEDLLAASGVAGIYYLTMVMADYGLVSGILMLMSRKAGENDKPGMAQLFFNGILLSLVMSLVMIVVSLLVAPVLFRAVIHEKAIAEAAVSFIRIRIWGLPFIVLCQLANSLFMSTSQSKYIIIGSGAQTVVNIFFDYLLIFGIWIFPEMGIEGTALASVISESSPLILQYFLSIGAWEVFFIYVEHLGKSESALSQIFRSVFGLVGVAAWALASTCNSMVSNLIGQQALDDVIPLIKKIVTISFLSAFVVGLPLLMFPRFFLHLLTSDMHLVEMGITSLRIVVLATWMLSVSTIVFNAVVGTGHTRTNMVFELISIVLYLMYTTIVIETLHMPLPYAWLSEFVYWLTLFSLSMVFFYSGKWKKIQR
jgi:Na+-driven multidrug efflux pump